MNIHTRRRNVRIGVAYIAEVLADVLQDAKDNGEGGLTAVDVRNRTGCSGTDLTWKICIRVLNHMENVGEAVNDKHGHGPDSWHLPD